MYEIKCGELWGGIHGTDVDAITSGVEANLFSSACDGGKGGDIYYFSVCAGDVLTRIAIADVVGHGKAVSDTSEWLYHSLRERMNIVDGNEVLSDLNSLAVERGYKAMTTAAVAAFHREANDLFFSYAGHHPVLISRTGDHRWTSLELPETDRAANLPLGVGRELPYDQSKISLHSGDLMFLYTDGVIEAPSPAGDLFGEAALLAALESAPDGPKDVKNSVLGALNMHVNGNLVHDDVTFMAVRIR
jgi:sigma-B regulation protein RsbU (phosphoserine phosphatase)